MFCNVLSFNKDIDEQVSLLFFFFFVNNINSKLRLGFDFLNSCWFSFKLMKMLSDGTYIAGLIINLLLSWFFF